MTTPSPSAPRLSLRLTPADVSLFRESRAFDQGATELRSELPNPGTAAGALRTWLLEGLSEATRDALRAFRRERRQGGPVAELLKKRLPPAYHWIVEARFFGPLLADRTETYYPAPFSLARIEEDGRRRVCVRPSPGRLPGQPARPDAAALRPLWTAQAGRWNLPMEGWIGGRALARRFLAGNDGLPAAALAGETGGGGLYGLEPRLGIGVAPERRAAEEGLLYSARFLRLARGLSFAVTMEVADEAAAAMVRALLRDRGRLRLGGEGRWARIAEASGVAAPDVVPDAAAPWPPPTGRFCTVLATPGRFAGGAGGWYPERLARRCELVGAAVGEPLLTSGWDIARGRPTPARAAVRAGAVYFWERRDDEPLEDPHGTCLSEDAEDARAGWGLCLRGAWD